MRVLDLFSGIGGFSLGLERAGMHTIGFCEIDPYCRAVLKKYWPDVPCYGDIRDLHATDMAAGGIKPELICGGFPCQDVSVAGARAGLDGARSGLWSEFVRLIREIRPKIAIVENTPGLLSLGMGTVLGDLASIGYDAEWHCIPASYVGALHIRDRVWIIANPHEERQSQSEGGEQDERRWLNYGLEKNFPAANTYRKRLEKRFMWPRIQKAARRFNHRENVAVGRWGSAESMVVRKLHGIPNRVDRINALGNAIVPQIAEMIGRAIMDTQARARVGNKR